MPSLIDRVILSYPTHLSEIPVVAAQPAAATTNPTSWIQIAKCGEFVSQRYGEFAITREDLSTMLHNFQNITPKAPTRLPIDVDHLSMSPEKPWDGVAAGWINDLALRDDGDTLWALVEWTPQGAAAIKDKQYQFVSPSFVKDYTDKSGERIGTTLLAAAITNHPFLEGMAALTLSAGLKEMATPLLLADDDAPPPFPTDDMPPPPTDDGGEGKVVMEVGQKVTVKDAEVQTPEQMGVVFTIGQVVGEGADAFVSLEAPDGTVAEWFRADELAPAPAQTEMPADMIPAPDDQQPAPAVAASAPPNMSTTMTPIAVNARREKSMSTEFRLTDRQGKEVTLSADVLQAIVAKAIPDQVLIKASEVTDLKSKVTNLTSQVDTLAKTAADAEARARAIELKTALDKLSKGGFITKVERDWAEKTFKGSTDLSAFGEWAATKNTPIMKLHTEHGSGLDTHQLPGEEASQRLMNLAQQIQKEKRISYRDALIQASKKEADAAETYKNQFRPGVQ